MDVPLGLTLLVDQAPLADRGIDIIAVHGLRGRARRKPCTTEDSSEDRNHPTFWLRDWLPANLPCARILTYGYDTSVFRSGCTIAAAADKLLDELTDLRADKEPRPLLFLCHSLGGLVVKSALSKAFQNRDDEPLSEIVTATQGIIFLGTPHSTSPSELSTSITRIAIGSEPTGITMVAVHSMQQILAQFMNLPWHILPWRIVSFYEELPLPASDFRAVDRSQMELGTFPRVSLNSHHHDLCSFTSEDDPSYLKVLESLRNITLGSNSTDQVMVHPTLSLAEDEVLRSLESDDLSTNVQDASHGTCNWILEHDAYKSWKQDSSSMLWIRGKPGSGKSTLLKYLINHDALGTTASSASPAYFFFSHRGPNQSVTSLLRSLLYQLLKSTSTSLTFEIFAKFTDKREIFGSDSPWDDDLLTENFFHLVDKSASLGNSFCFFIDALDECNDPDRVVSLFQRLNTTMRHPQSIRTCISSRHSPIISPAREVRMEDNNGLDMKSYLHDKLIVWKTPFPPKFDVQALVENITEKSEGVFLWVTLAVSNLLVGVQQKLFETALPLTELLPAGLDAAYETTLGRLLDSHDMRRRRDAQDILSLVICAIRPLSTLELWDALAVTRDGLDGQQRDWALGEREELYVTKTGQGTTQPDIASQLTVLCGGLLRVVPEVPREVDGCMTISGQTVQLIHESAREFLLRKNSSSLNGDQGKDCEADLHFGAARICLSYISRTFASSRHTVSDRATSPAHFLRYAVTYSMQHLNLASGMGLRPRSGGVWQSPPFQDGFIDQWVYLHNQLFGDQNLFKPGKTKAAHIMSYFGLPWLDTGVWGGKSSDIDAHDHYGQTPLSFAAAMGHLNLCEALVERGADVRHRDHIYGQTPLNLAAAHGHRVVVEFLLHVDPDHSNDTSGVSALWMAVGGGHLKTVELLLEAGANATTANVHTGESALSRAAVLGHIPIISLLLKSGAKVENRDKRGWTPLHHAVSRSRKRSLELLLGTLTQENLQALRAGPVKAQNSWVHKVLGAIILGLCFRQCHQSQSPPPSGHPPEPETPSTAGHNLVSTASSAKRGRRKMDPDSDEDDVEEDHIVSQKRVRQSNPSGRRFACPYHRRNAEKYPSGACNGKGFENTHRLKTHLKKEHSRISDWQRCHICQTHFRHAEIIGHEPCVKREVPTDYEDGFDAVQHQKLTSKELFPGRSSEENCWYAIFRLLFPDWPEIEDIPSPYQDEQNQVMSYAHREAIGDIYDTILSPDTISEIVTHSKSGGEQGARQFLEGLLGGLERKHGLSSMREIVQVHRGPAGDPLAASRPRVITRSRPVPAAGVAPIVPPLPEPASSNTIEAYLQTARNHMEGYEDSSQYLPLPDNYFPQNYPSRNPSLLGPHLRPIPSSSLDSASVYSNTIGSGVLTDNTTFSNHGFNGLDGLGSMNNGGSVIPVLQARAAYEHYLPTNAQPSLDTGYPSGTMIGMNSQGTVSYYVGPSATSWPQRQQHAPPIGLGQNITAQTAQFSPTRGNVNRGPVTAPSQADAYMNSMEPHLRYRRDR